MNMIKILLFLLILYPNLSEAQYYYAPYPPVYPSPNYQRELNNYIQQQFIDDSNQRDRDAYKETRTWEKSEEYRDPWGFKKQHKPFDDD
jgi:hypothetical protein